MSDIDTALKGHHAAVSDIIAAAESSADAWTTPREPGKWSPAQVSEHIALSLEESAKVVAGTPSKFPTLPAFVRPLVRGVFFKRILKSGTFPKAKTPKAFDPAQGPATPADARVRLEGAAAKFDQECRKRAAAGADVVSGVFGAVSVADYARFQELHTRHHRKHFTNASGGSR
jgi:hypothetical protein